MERVVRWLRWIDTIAVWKYGPVGQFAMVSAFLLGAGRVIEMD